MDLTIHDPRQQEKDLEDPLNPPGKSMQQKTGTTMQERKPATRPFRVFFRLLLALNAMVGALCLSLFALITLMRLKWVNDKVRRLSKKGNVLARKIAGTRLGSLYFNLSALKHVGRKSGREYVTPLSAYPLGDGFVLAQAYPTLPSKK